MDIDGVSILGHGITALGPRGVVFENVNVSIGAGSLAVIAGAAGSGRTSLLLALSGRLRIAAGSLEVSGYQLPKEAKWVRRLIVPARVRPGFELDPTLRVREVAAERRALADLSDPDIDDALSFVGLDPDPALLVGDLHPGDLRLLEIGLGAAAAPSGMLVDDVDEGLPIADRMHVWRALRDLTEIGMTVVATTTDPVDDTEEIRLPPPIEDPG